MINVIPVFVLHRLREWEFKNMVSLGSALNSEPQRVQRGMAVVVAGMRHEVTWHDRGKDLGVLSLSEREICSNLGRANFSLFSPTKSRVGESHVSSLSNFSLEKLNPDTLPKDGFSFPLTPCLSRALS